MKRLISFSSMAFAALFLTGCAVVADPYPVHTTAVIRTSPNVIVYDGWHDGAFYERGRVIRRMPNYHRPPQYPRFHHAPPPRPHMHRPPPPGSHMHRPGPPRPHMNRPGPGNGRPGGHHMPPPGHRR